MEKQKNPGVLRRYLPSVIAAVLLFVLMAGRNDLLSQTDAKAVFGALSDCFLMPGVVIGGLGGFSWIASTGAYDILGYGGRAAWERIGGIFGRQKENISYYDYKQEKAEARGKPKISWLIVGGVCIALSVLCLVIYALL